MAWAVGLSDGDIYVIYDDEGWYVASCRDEHRAKLIATAPQMMEALCSIRDMAECILQPLPVGCVAQVRWTRVRDQAVKAIAMTQGENDEAELV